MKLSLKSLVQNSFDYDEHGDGVIQTSWEKIDRIIGIYCLTPELHSRMIIVTKPIFLSQLVVYFLWSYICLGHWCGTETDLLSVKRRAWLKKRKIYLLIRSQLSQKPKFFLSFSEVLNKHNFLYFAYFFATFCSGATWRQLKFQLQN